MIRYLRHLSKLLLLLLLPELAFAAQILEVIEDQPSYAKISAREITRIRVVNGRIAHVRGTQGELVIDKESERGEIYVKPLNQTKIVNLFVTTESNRTYTLVLQPVDTPATSILLREPSRSAGPNARAVGYQQGIQNLIVAMASGDMPEDTRIEEIGRETRLWEKSTFFLEKRYVQDDVVGEKYSLTNRTGTTMVIAEQEFAEDGVQAVSVERMQLRDGDTTYVFIVRRRGNHE